MTMTLQTSYFSISLISLLLLGFCFLFGCFFFFFFFNRWQNNCRKGEDLICMPSFLQLERGLQDSTESGSEVAQLCLTLCDPMDCSLPGSSVHEIFQARVLEWVAISSSRGSSQPRDRTQVSCIAGRHFTIWAAREATEPGIKWWAVLCWGPESLLRKRTKEMLELTF